MGTRVLIMAGGTGGHVFPALAVAKVLQTKGAEVIWMGTRQGLEAQLIPEEGIDIEWVSVSGLRGKGVLSWVLSPIRLVRAVAQALGIVLRRKPAMVLGMGGFVAGPGGLASWLLRKPLVIHEQNAIAGLTNRLLAPLSVKVLEAFPGTFPTKLKPITIGNPVRREIAEVLPPEQRFADSRARLRLLIIGGSLGATALNKVAPEAVKELELDERPEIWHQTGQRNIEDTRRVYEQAGVAARIEPFITDMSTAYEWADIVLCRAGALTVSELAAAGAPAILVPYPYAVDDHQTKNARFLVAAGAALLVSQIELTPSRLRDILRRYSSVADTDSQGSHSSGGKSQLLAMAQQARRLARPGAADAVCAVCLEVAHV